MVATRRSRSLDVKEESAQTTGKDPPSRSKSSTTKTALASSTKRNTTVDDEQEDIPARHSARLRGTSPQPARTSRNASRSLDSDFEWESHTSTRQRSSERGRYTERDLDYAGTRRSLRNRTTNYISLDEDLIQYPGPGGIDIRFSRSRRDSARTSQKRGSEEKRERRGELSNLLAAQGKDLSDMKNQVEPDIYSSVKSRVRVSTRDKLYEQYFTPGTSKKKKQEEEESQSEETEEDDDDEQTHEEDDDDDEEEEEDDEEEGHPYKLRKVRAAPKRYMIVREVQTKRPRSLFEDLPCSPARRRRRRTPGTPGQEPYLKRRRRARTQGNSSTSDNDSSSDDEIKFRKRQQKSMARARNECLPINLSSADLTKHSYARERKKIGQSLADIDPMALDNSITFSSVGGHNKHIRALKEMVVFPLLYPEVFEKFSITPPRGCLFYGPPGTGKTLMARALANECSTDGKKVSFFMKKGADCLSKWIGESERQLRVLFDQAYQMRPSIIFFDEIDGLAPVRSSRQDQIHSSIVSTLLALMDGLDSRGEIIVIGATNRIDSIDPALRRPGRFDREFLFPLPDKQAREAILRIHTKAWNPQLKPSFIEYLAAKTVGYCGADVKALCTEAALIALRRRYPQIYQSRDKLQLDVSTISIQATDFNVAVKNIIPTAQRSVSNPGRALSSTVKPLLGDYLQGAVLQLSKVFPVLKSKSKVIQLMDRENLSGVTNGSEEGDIDMGGHMGGIYVGESDPVNRENLLLPLLSGNNNGVVQSQYSTLISRLSSAEHSLTTVHRPRFIICGDSACGSLSHLTPALVHDMEGIPIHCLDLPTLYGISARTPEESCAQVFREARRLTPSVIYLPNALQWWSVASATIQATLESLLQDIPPNVPILFLATSNCSYRQLPREFAKFFHSDFDEVHEAKVVFNSEQRREFFAPIFLIHATSPPHRNRLSNAHLEILPKAPAPEPAPLTEEEEKRLEKEEESTLRNLRLFLRDLLMRLERDRRFKIFSKPVDFEEVPDYTQVIKRPMDFATMQTKIDQHKYQTAQLFLEDIDLICNNALEYNPDRRPEDKLIRHRACSMRDMAHAIVDTDLDPEFDKLCQETVESRKRRGASTNKFAPKFYPVLPKHLMVHPITGEVTPKPDYQPPLIEVNPTESAAEKTPWKPQIKRPHSTTKHRRKRSSWSRGILASAKKRKKVSHVIESSEEEDENPEDIPKEADTGDENRQDSEGDENATNGHLDDDYESAEENQTSEQQGEIAQTSDVKEPLSVSFQEGTEMEIDIDQDSGKDPSSHEEEKVNDDSHTLSNGYGLDDVPQDEIELDEEEFVQAHDKPTDEEEAGSNDSHIPDEVVEIQEVQEEVAPPRKMMLRPRNRSTSESQTPVNEMQKPASPLPPPPPFIVDHKMLLELLEEVVTVTESYTLDELERAHASLSRCVEKYKMEYDRTALTEDLAKEIHSLSSVMGQNH